MVESYRIQIESKGDGDVLDLTAQVTEYVRESKIESGIVTVFVPGSTAAVTTVEYEPGLKKDLPEFFQRIIPRGGTYHHDATWGDGNGFSHVRAALVGPSLTVPVSEGRLILGTWQQLVLLDFDNRARRRDVVIQVMGE